MNREDKNNTEERKLPKEYYELDFKIKNYAQKQEKNRKKLLIVLTIIFLLFLTSALAGAYFLLKYYQ